MLKKKELIMYEQFIQKGHTVTEARQLTKLVRKRQKMIKRKAKIKKLVEIDAKINEIVKSL